MSQFQIHMLPLLSILFILKKIKRDHSCKVADVHAELIFPAHINIIDENVIGPVRQIETRLR